MPTVSVIIPSYNHEKYVGECIQSVLDQSYQDFEIIITDDGSTDRTVEIIANLHDPRIKLFRHSENKGAPASMNNCISHARGKYIAPLGSDDAWYPHKLEMQVEYMHAHPEIAVLFSKVDWMDETGLLIPDEENAYKAVFDVENRTRFEWLRHFFQQGNCLNMPSSLIRSTCFKEIGLLNPLLAALHDFDLWVRICLEHDIMILDEKLVRYRWMSDHSNASGDNLKSRLRSRFEYKQLLNDYLKIKDTDELLLIFPQAAEYGKITPDLIPYFVARLALDRGMDFAGLWGLEVIEQLLKNEKTASKLEKYCDFTYPNFAGLTGEFDAFNLAKMEQQLAKIAQQDDEILRQDIEMAQRDAQIAQRDATIASIYGSKSWQATEYLGRTRDRLLHRGS